MERAAKTMKLIPISQFLYNQVMEQIMAEQYIIPLDGQEHYEPIYSSEQRYHILRYLINFLESKQAELLREMS